MKFFAHRINTIEELSVIDKCYGVELDLRDYNDDVIVQHDPYKDAITFKKYIKEVTNRDMILNIKCEMIERQVIEILKENHYNGNYILLDCSFPMIYSLSRDGNKNIALRFSEFEGLDTLINMKGMIEWVWIDVFTKLPLTIDIYTKIKGLGYKICLVSPELQGREFDIENYAKEIKDFKIDAICCKYHNINKWKSLLS